ncbi:Zinc finger protein 229 [Channa argus]|uniref:Zinc finger protein 229 n=1 Tax=Channa argus TaxID=215402 RepID=A0A6G1Q897_CHAAH|nr:Zinc finger protein 229 [Channa argus]
MSSVHPLREFVTERLTAAAEEILGVFAKATVEYQEEIERQRRLLAVVLKPQIKLNRIELPGHYVCKEEEVLTDQQLYNPERNFSLDTEEPEPPQIKEEQEELIQEGEQLVLKQETETLMLNPTNEEFDQSIPEPNTAHQLLSRGSPVAESKDQEGRKHVVQGLTTHPKTTSQSINVHNSESENHCNTRTGKKSFKGDGCGKAFQKESELIRHTTIHTSEKPYVCNTCGKRFSQRTRLNVHLKIHTDKKPYSCKTCGRAFRENSDLKVHSRIHTGERPFSCKICMKTFLVKSTLSTHMRIHTGEKPYSCKICGRAFRVSSVLKVHMRIHTGERPYTCNTCGKRFRENSSLKRHMKVHTGKKPYCCKTCGKRFICNSNLLVHMRSHTGEKPFSCKICRKGFTVNSNLLVHMRTHTGEKPFSCKKCGACFKRTNDLKIHLRHHTGEKPYSCNTCGKRFRESSALRSHMKCHTNDRPYSCEICGKKFTYRSNFMVHSRTHTEFVTERLTAAAEEIFGVFEKTIAEYQEELVRQRKLLDIIWKPEIQLPRIELPQLYVCKKVEGLNDQQPCDQKENCGLDQEHPQPSQMKEEKEELCSNQEGEEIVLKQETEISMLVPTDEESDHSEAEPKRDHQLLSDSSSVAESQDQEGSQHVDLPSTINAEPKVKRRRCNNKSHTKNADNSHTALESQLEETRTQLETMRQSLGQIRARLQWGLSSSPAQHNQLTTSPSHPSCGHLLFPPSAESLAEEKPLSFPPQVKPASPASCSTDTTIPPQEQDVTLRVLSAEREDALFKDCFVRGEHRPDVYAANIFMALAPFDAYRSWVKRVNWSGSNSKAELPQNLKDKVHEYITQRFPELSTDQWLRIRNKINERLRSSRKVDPEKARAGFPK